MKIITKTPINKELIGERQIGSYSYKESTGESNDGMRRGLTYTVICKKYGNLEMEQKNSDGTYTYNYTSYIKSSENTTKIRKPEESNDDLRKMTEELIFEYNIHNFVIEEQEKEINIQDYYVAVRAESTYKKDEEPYLIYTYGTYSKEDKDYTETDDHIIWCSCERIKTESIEDLNSQIKGAFSKNNYILYLLDEDVKKIYHIKLGLDEIEENETVKEFLEKMAFEKPQSKNIEEAMNTGEINIDDIENFISSYENINGSNMPSNILEQIFEKKPELATNFIQSTLDTEIQRRYYPNFDIMKIKPDKLYDSDLDQVLEGFKRKYLDKEKINEYLKYLEQFYNNPEPLKKILQNLNTEKSNDLGRSVFPIREAKSFANGIPKEILDENEIRDIILNTENISIETIIYYQFNYDEKSSKKLLDLLRNSTSKVSLSNLNSIIDIARQNNIKDDEILEIIRENGFNIKNLENKELEKFKKFGIKGITVEDIHNTMLKEKDFGLLSTVEEKDQNKTTKEFYNILNALAERKGKRDNEDKKRHEEMFELIENYSNTHELFSNLNPEIKELTKKMIIENLDVDEQMEKYSVSIYGSFEKIMKTLTTSFDIDIKDFTTIYMKCLNTGAYKEETIKAIEEFIPEEQRNEFENTISKLNIYPTPKYFWLTDKYLKRIGIDWNNENRATIKSKIQADGRCFSTRIKTDMSGISKDGKKIPVNNLSKWLFGVPGARGYLTVTKCGDYIQLPSNTPEEVVELIVDVLNERKQEEPSR
ncbi:MAG: hypothetical protein IJE05_06120 [Clostridia bacterium]|nr:hypothetical protein [Clostridia bacterium]